MPSLQSLIVFVLALAVAAIAAAATESFQPLPLFVGVIAVGAWRSWKLARAPK